ncbi:sugar-binding transcriptional regulator [Enterococcus sp. C63]|uniref:sugar-binding transcriptional regulator n=1 Tax=Enterococcus sp. C63 TaxID=3231324 RepID=UPI0034A0A77F
MSKSEERNMVKVATLYYKEGLTQAQIAKKMGVSRSLISKWLIDARKAGFIEFFINSENIYAIELETELEKKFALSFVKVVDKTNLSYPEIEKMVGQIAAISLKDKIAAAKTIGISWGKSIKSLVTQFPFENYPDTTFIPLIGGMGYDHFDIHSNQLCHEFARKTRGSSKYLYTPALVSNEIIRQEFEGNIYIDKILSEAKKVELALVGISSPDHFNTMEEIGYTNKKEMAQLRGIGAVGDINSRFYDKDGQEVNHPINKHVVGLSLEELKAIPETIAIAYDDAKWQGIYYACKNQLIDSIITTDTIADHLIHMDI